MRAYRDGLPRLPRCLSFQLSRIQPRQRGSNGRAGRSYRATFDASDLQCRRNNGNDFVTPRFFHSNKRLGPERYQLTIALVHSGGPEREIIQVGFNDPIEAMDQAVLLTGSDEVWYLYLLDTYKSPAKLLYRWNID